MERVLVICSAGASGTFLVHWMRSEALRRGLELSVEAAGSADLESRLRGVGVILVGHHLVADFPDIRRMASDAGASASLLPPLSFDAAGATIALDIVSGLHERLLVPTASTVSTLDNESGRTHG